VCGDFGDNWSNTMFSCGTVALYGPFYYYYLFIFCGPSAKKIKKIKRTIKG
jgi:hypothetical protein